MMQLTHLQSKGIFSPNSVGFLRKYAHSNNFKAFRKKKITKNLVFVPENAVLISAGVNSYTAAVISAAKAVFSRPSFLKLDFLVQRKGFRQFCFV